MVTCEGSISATVLNDKTYGIVVDFYDALGSYEVIVDGHILVNVDSDELVEMK